MSFRQEIVGDTFLARPVYHAGVGPKGAEFSDNKHNNIQTLSFMY